MGIEHDSIKSRHGQYSGKGLWNIEDILIDGAKSSIMVMFGYKIIGDKCCYKIGKNIEKWFDPNSVIKKDIIVQGKQLIIESLQGKTLKFLNGNDYIVE